MLIAAASVDKRGCSALAVDHQVTSVTASVLWNRLDTPGHDACQLRCSDNCWELGGTAVFLNDGTAACLSYQVVCNSLWQSQHGRVRGWIGDRHFDLAVVRTSEGLWQLNGAIVPGLEGCVDLDLGFTPATNLLQLRRVALRDGEEAEVPVAWLDVPAATLERLPQRYERRTGLTYWYEAPTVGYSGLLELNSDGFVRRYPRLWETELSNR